MKADGPRLESHWIWVVYRGVVTTLFGLLAFARPAASTLALILALGAYAFVGGFAAIGTAARRDRAGASRDMLLLDGIMGIALAFVALWWPTPITVTLAWVVGAWAIATGAMELVNAARLRRLLAHEWSLAVAGLGSIVFGFVLLVRPLAGGLAVMWSLGGWALGFGALTIALGLRLRRAFLHSHAVGGLVRALP
jgi:uncharacterized membrane protein HdeD (DUF308 family)